MSKEEEKRELHPAEIAKNEAEARKADAEARAAEALARKTDAEARKAEAEAIEVENRAPHEARRAAAWADETELNLVSLRHEADRANEKRRKEKASDDHHHVYHFKGAVDNASAEKCLDQLKFWQRTEKPGKIELVFFSPGGSVLAGMALFDHILAMRQDGWHFTTVCRGYSASMAGILLQAGDERVCGPESYILIHEISSGAVGKIGELEDEVEFVKLIQRRVNDIFVSRSGGKVTGAKLRSMYRRKDMWIDSDTALKLGICDRVG